MDYDRVLNTNFNFTNINIYNRISNGVHTGYQAIPYDGYVMYDTKGKDKDVCVLLNTTSKKWDVKDFLEIFLFYLNSQIKNTFLILRVFSLGQITCI